MITSVVGALIGVATLWHVEYMLDAEPLGGWRWWWLLLGVPLVVMTAWRVVMWAFSNEGVDPTRFVIVSVIVSMAGVAIVSDLFDESWSTNRWGEYAAMVAIATYWKAQFYWLGYEAARAGSDVGKLRIVE